MNVMMLLEMASDAFGERVAVGDATTGLTYGRLFELAGKTATWLRAKPAERLLFTDLSSEVLPIALFGSAWAGRPFVPVSYRLADDRLRPLLGRQAPAVVLYGEGTEDRVSGIDGIEAVSTKAFMAEIEAIDEIPERNWSNDPDDLAVLLHTSGTSGDPKVALLRHKHLGSYVIGSVEFMGSADDEATLVSVPPYHIAGVSALLTATYSGRRIVQLPAFEPADWVRLVREHSVTHAMVVPTMLGRILDAIEDGKGLPSLRHLSYGGGRMPLPVIERAMQLLPDVDYVNAYGLTETSSSIAILGPDEHREAMATDEHESRRRLASVGRPLPTVEIEIRDEDGKPVPAGEKGEVWVRGEQVSGEYSQKGATTDNDGWFPTHDGGWFDSEGYLYVDGRMDDVIVRGGENLSPGEIEDCLLQHQAVAEAAVVGVPDNEWGEAVAAVIVLHEGATATADELRGWVSSHLRSTRAPAIVEFRDLLPYNDTGKLLRRVLRDELSPAS